ncbi:MFS general substrate transporter [Raphidocelis subcapitata]|uniref:MFS general substrate transporter n=1 Tax=Raphidocelis subcapitata TaxID=307507 RepID=A0A2V0NJU6_9CHLO|nr:MFS general substrate transporter [Raphidocelis subcapitata]|eukprot:GBF87528.1 MFS general substrate transporter [Raphidocelis subcapitata]
MGGPRGAGAPRGPQPVAKWWTFAASCAIQACAGLGYSFSVYAPAIKEKMGLNQVEIATVGSAVNLGGYFAIVSGAIYDATKDMPSAGPRLVISMGSLCCVCGYLGMWLMVSGRAKGGFAELLMLAVCAGNMGVWYDTTAIVTNVRNFPRSRGYVVGILKSFLGLSASIYTTVYTAAFAPDAVTFLLVLGLAPAAICSVLSLFVNYVPFVEACEMAHTPGSPAVGTERRFLYTYGLVAVIAGYQCLSALAEAHDAPSQSARAALAAGCLLLLCGVGAIPRGTGGLRAVYGHEHAAGDADEGLAPRTASGGGGGGGDDRDSAGGRAGGERAVSPRRRAARDASPAAARAGRERSRGGADHERLPLLMAAAGGAGGSAALDGPASAGGAPPPAAPHPSPPPSLAAGDPPAAPLPNLNTMDMARSFEAWCVFAQFCVGTGVALAMLNNMGQLVVALGGPRGGQVALVSLFSVANAAGRLVMGYWPEKALHGRGTPRPLFLAGVAAAMALVSLATAYASLAALYPMAVLMGLLFGSHWSLVPAICSDLFGLAHFGSNYTALQFAPAMGSYLLATRLTGALYDAAAAAHGDPRDCVGPDCFRAAFLVLAALALAGAAACAAAAARSRRVYAAIARHMREAEEAEARLSP